MKFPEFSWGIDWKELRKFEKLDEHESSIVFYAENKASMNHFKTLIFELTEKMDLEICYVTSVKDDPMLSSKNLKIQSFYIGDGTARTKFFLRSGLNPPNAHNFSSTNCVLYELCIPPKNVIIS